MKRKLALILAVLLVFLSFEVTFADIGCHTCKGKGKITCPDCGGSGTVRRYGGITSGCSRCRGQRIIRCVYCGGDGKIGAGDTGKAITISNTKLTLVKGHKETLRVDGTKKKVKWKSSKTSVATVNSKGVVKAKKAGTCTITAKVGKKKLKCKVTVIKPVYADNVKLNVAKASLLPGAVLDLKATISPDISKITEEWSLTWSTSNKNVATVSYGKVSIKKPGTATITALLKIKPGKTKKAVCTVSVETGLTRFQRWFNKNCKTVNGKKVCYTGNNDSITFDPSSKKWIFKQTDSGSINSSVCTLTFNQNFTGSATAYYLYTSKLSNWQIEGKVALGVSGIARNMKCNWKYTEGKGDDKYKQADKALTALLSGMYVTLRDKAGLNARGGWRDLGLSSY